MPFEIKSDHDQLAAILQSRFLNQAKNPNWFAYQISQTLIQTLQPVYYQLKNQIELTKEVDAYQIALNAHQQFIQWGKQSEISLFESQLATYRKLIDYLSNPFDNYYNWLLKTQLINMQNYHYRRISYLATYQLLNQATIDRPPSNQQAIHYHQLRFIGELFYNNLLDITNYNLVSDYWTPKMS